MPRQPSERSSDRLRGPCRSPGRVREWFSKHVNFSSRRGNSGARVRVSARESRETHDTCVRAAGREGTFRAEGAQAIQTFWLAFETGPTSRLGARQPQSRKPRWEGRSQVLALGAAATVSDWAGPRQGLRISAHALNIW